MKRLLMPLILSLTLFLRIASVQASPDFQTQAVPLNKDNLFEVSLVKVVDGDTAYFRTAEQEEIKARFLLIDTPELRHPQTGKQPFADEAKERVSQLLEDAEHIFLEYDVGARLDKYQRDLVYVWADDLLVQELLAAEGLADVTYIYPPNTRYLDDLETAKLFAQDTQQGLWGLPSAFGEIEQASASGTTATNEADMKNQSVYIAPLSGSKYHFDKDCRGLRKAASIEMMTQKAAIDSGYDLCGYEH